MKKYIATLLCAMALAACARETQKDPRDLSPHTVQSGEGETSPLPPFLATSIGMLSREEREALRARILDALPERTSQPVLDERLRRRMMAREYAREAMMEDASGGSAYGVARAEYVDDAFLLLATLVGLPDPEQGSRYDGWLVRREPFAVMWTGEVERKSGFSLNAFTSAEDLSAYDVYVVTHEPQGERASIVLEGIVSEDLR